MRRTLCLVLALVMILLSGCSAVRQSPDIQNVHPVYESYRDIHGVTQGDIDALEDLLAKKPRLVYGFIVTSDAFLREDGSVGGFTPMLCNRMSELFGFEFDLIPFSWEDLIDKTLSAEIDLIGDLTATPERLQQYLMTNAIVQRTLKMFTHKDVPGLSLTASERPLRCAFLEGGVTYQRVADTWGLPFEPVFIDDEAKVPGMLLSGEIDVFIEEGIIEASFDDYDYIKAEEYYPLTYSPVSLATANPELEPLIRIMQKYIDNGGYYELTELHNLGYKDYLRNKLYGQLSLEDREYIKSHQDAGTVILAACEVDNYPTSFYNSNEKEFQGIALDTLNRISELTGLTFQVGNKPDALWPELIEGLENGEYSLCSELLRSSQREGRFIWADQSYCTNNYALLSKAEYPDIDINQVLFSRIGLMEDAGHTDVFLEWFPDSANTAFYYSGTDEAFAALEKGEIDLLMASEIMLLNLTNYQEKPGYKANVVFNYSSDSFLGFNKDEEVLRSIANKALDYANTDEITARWQRKVFDYQSKLLKDMLPYLGLFVGLLTVALFVMVFLSLKNKRISKNLEKLVKERTHELALQTATLTTIFESIPDLIFCKDLDLRFTRCNKSFERHFNCNAESIIGKNDVDGIGLPPEMAEQFNEIDRQIIREGRKISVEEVIPSADGDMPIFETVKIPLMQDGDVIGIMGISRDITRRKAAENTLKLTLDNLDACVYITDIETGEILFINRKMTEEYGDADCIGKKCWEVLQEGKSGRCDFCAIPKLIASGDKDYVWEEYSTITGKYYRNTDSLIRWHDGRLVHMQHSVDITDLIRLQQDLGSASKAKGDFLSRMSHEIRTPLNAIIGMVNIAMGTSNNEKTKDCLIKADNASKHLLGVINDILDMSKIEADKFELDHREFSFEKMLMSVTNVTNFRVEEKKQSFIVNISGNVPEAIIGDDLRLSQVLTNLLTNAVKFTPEYGKISLNIDKIGDDSGEVTLKVEVKDNGIGISEEQQKRLFTSFEQADGGIARKFGGTGLGLAISKRIVELMGGRIWIESELGKGSKFIFTMKVGKGNDNARAKLSDKIKRDDMRILAVDDSPDIREYFSYVMENLGLPCDLAATGAEALRMVESCGSKPYNIFFIDWQMPKMNGIELTRKIKETAPDNSVVFMISVAEWSAIEKEALAAGVRSFISKPLFPSTLVNAINGCLEIGPQKPKVEAESLRDRKQRSYSGKRILIAEDVEINREIMSAVLEDTGMVIDYAENGAMAVSMFQVNPGKYNLVLMDIQMPEMDGYEATRRIRALQVPQAKEIPIIAMTANVFREDIDSCLAAGMNDHIGKPVDQEELFAKLEKYLHLAAIGQV